jgi:alpha 1,2-mannosyltransferase
METFGLVCVDGYEAAKQHQVRRLEAWELKPFAVCHSGLEEALYLDADYVALLSPEFLFESEMYARHGAIFWPDRFRGPGTGQEWLKREAWQLCGVPYRLEPEIEAGQLVFDKQRCWQALALTLHLNEHSDF